MAGYQYTCDITSGLSSYISEAELSSSGNIFLSNSLCISEGVGDSAPGQYPSGSFARGSVFGRVLDVDLDRRGRRRSLILPYGILIF